MAVRSTTTQPKAHSTVATPLQSEYERWKIDQLGKGKPVAGLVQAHQKSGMIGLAARSVIEGLGDFGSMALGSLSGDPVQAAMSAAMPAGPTQDVQQMAQTVAGDLPTAQTGPQRLMAATIRGATAGGPFGVPGLVGGAAAGLAGSGAQEMGVQNPAALGAIQLLAGAVGGKGAAMAQQHFSPTAQAAQSIAAPMAAAGDQPVQQLQQAAATARGSQNATGREVLGREGQAASEALAGHGGPAGRTVVARTQDLANQIANEFSVRKQAMAEADVPRQQALMEQASQRTRELKATADRQFQDLLGRAVQDPAGGVNYERVMDHVYAPAVERAYSMIDRVNVQVTPELARLLRDPVVESAWESARRASNVRVEGDAPGRVPVRQIPPLTETVPRPGTESNPLGIERSMSDAMGSSPEMVTRVRETLPLRAFDALKKNLQAAQHDKALTDDNRANATAALSRLDAIIRDHIDQQVPAYADARALAEEFARRRDALLLGRNLTAPAGTRSVTRGQISQTEVNGPDEAQAAYDQQTPHERTDTRAGLIYDLNRLAAKPNAAKAIGNPDRFAPWLTPEEIQRIRTGQEMSARTVGGRSDVQMTEIKGQLAADRVGNALRVDPETQRIAERAAGADRVLTAGARNPQTTPNVGKRILADVLLHLKRMALLDAYKASGQPMKLPPSARGKANLAEAVTAKGDPLAAILEEYIRQQQSRGQGAARGAAGAATQGRRQ